MEDELMGVSANERKMSQGSSVRKGGFRTMPFIIVNEAFEKVASYGLMPNMIFYLMKGYGLDSATGTSILFIWSATSNAMAMVGAFLSDSYLGRFRVIALGSFASLLGMIMLWLTAMIPQSKPPPCSGLPGSCTSATPAQLALLFSSFGMISIGAGCIRPCSIAFGADQLIKKDDPGNEGLLQSFFNWYYASTGVSTILALTVIVYIQDHLGWKVGFAVPVILMFISAVLFILGSPLFVKVKATKSLFTGFFQVLVAAFRNRSLAFPAKSSDVCYYHSQDSVQLEPTSKLRCLNKACIIRNPATDLNPDGSSSNPWKLCTVDQVEALKSLLKVIPMWSTNIMILVSINQTSFSVLQANSMDRHITSKFQIPAGSFTVFMVLTVTIWVALYDRVIVPIMAKYMGRPRGLGQKQRMGIGLLLSAAGMAVSAIVESVRRSTAIREGLVDHPRSVVNMSAMWLVPQFCLFGLAEGVNAVAQIEFYYSYFSKSMGSLAMALFTLGMAAANLIGSLLVRIVDEVTKKGGKESWVSNNLNKGHYDYYYWLISIMGMVNFLYFLVCCWFYERSGEEAARSRDEVEATR